MSIKRYKAGDERPGLVVLGVARDGLTADERRYAVRLTCCGRTVEMSHRLVGLKKSERCSDCYSADMTNTGRRGLILTAELPGWCRPKPCINSYDIDRHLARVFPWSA